MLKPGASVEFDGVVLKYQSHMEPVLNSISFKIAAGERIGIVGRSGSGKSTLMVALMRLVELSKGRIYIESHDIGQLGLRFLRTLVTVIPQEPVMFSGSLRTNLDPLGTYSDEQLVSSCSRSGLKQARPSLGLEDLVQEAGANFSPGEQQLVCMARALLCRNPVMLFDEATASLDVESDAFLQRVLRTEFRGATILTVAHRLDTICDYDRILTMSAGKVAEFDKPSALLSRGGIFANLAKEAGLTLAKSSGAVELGDIRPSLCSSSCMAGLFGVSTSKHSL